MRNSTHYFRYLLGLEKAQTQTSEAERACLREHAEGKSTLCEIGVFHGVNTKNFREVMSPQGVIIAIDPYPRSFLGLRGYGWAKRVAHREVGRVRVGSVVWVEDTGENAPRLERVAGLLPVDFLFIDGDHSYEGLKGDWESWSNHITKNGIVALHDSHNTGGSGSEKFTEEVILNDSRFEKIAVIDSLTVLRRREF